MTSDLNIRQSVLIAGGTGFIGSALCRKLAAGGYKLTVLTRRSQPNQGNVRYMTWAPQDPETAASLLSRVAEDHAFVVNLAGESVISGRWNSEVKGRILESRLSATRVLVRAMEQAERRPGLLINASAVGYYGPQSGDAPLPETSPAGKDFLASVCGQWEAQAQQAEKLGVRVVRLRIGMVLGRGGGAFEKMHLPFWLGVGGPLGSGRQMVSWIHIEDLTGMILWLMGQPRASGAVNAVAPRPVTNEELSRTLARVLHRPCFVRTPAFLVRLLGESSALFLDGQNAIPQAALNAGFRFQFPELEPALRQLAG